MSSRKRTHFAVARDEISSVDRASSTFSQDASRKRARVVQLDSRDKHSTPQRNHSPSQASSENDIEDSEEEQEDEEARERGDSPPRTQYEIMRDDGFKHLDNTDMDDRLATQKINSRSQRVGDNRSAENGIVESVECVNFMCHERLYVELGPLINFIVGENGSGKSAVLTALTLCLGGKASSTNRGGSLKSFIKEGRDQSVITVCIKNQGADAYQPEIYGDTIKVERHFSRSGTSGFRVKSERGRTISTKKADIDEITDYWGLQVDNPLNVLSQDNARQFLNAASPALKYKYFFKGVQLEQLDNDYKLVCEILESHGEKLAKLKDSATQLERDYEKAKKDKELVDANQSMRERVEQLRAQLVWCQVANAEAELEKRRDEVLSFDDKLADASQGIARATEKLEKCDESVKQVEAEVSEKAQAKQDHEEAVETVASKYREAKARLEKGRLEHRDAHQHHKTAQATVQSWKEKVEAEEQKLTEASGDARRQLQERLDAAQAEEKKLVQEVADLKAEGTGLDGEGNVITEKEQQIEQRHRQKTQELSQAHDRLRSLQSKNDNGFGAFDPKIPQLLKAIERETAFEKRPIGPVGSYIQLANPIWSSILETTFGAFLNSFLVSNKADQERLSRLMHQLGINGIPITIGKLLPRGVTLRQPDEKFLTILRALKIENEWVRDQLIINYSIEKIILVESRKEAQEIMFSGSPPRDVTASLSLHDKKRGQGVRLHARASGLSTTFVMAFTRRPRMKSDGDAQVRLQEETVQLLEREEADIRHEKEAVRDSRRQFAQRVRACEQGFRDLDKKLTKIRAKILDLNVDNDEFDGADGRLAQFREELEKAKVDAEHHGRQYGDIHVNLTSLGKDIDSCRAELHEKKKDHADLELDLAKAEQKLKRSEDLRLITLEKKNAAYTAQEELQRQKGRAIEQRDLQMQEVAEFTSEASAACPVRVPIDEGQTYSTLEKSYMTIREQLQRRAERMGATDEEINDRLREAQAAYAEASQVYKLQTGMQQMGNRSLELRLKKWRFFQRHISARSRMNFKYLLSERGFRGSLLFDHEMRKLQLSVEPDETRKKGTGRNTKTLSGGEKSFSSICMLLAIWEAMGSPLRCLDEFDVFMDNVNRTISTNMLITAARRSVCRQYIMITPNAIEGRASLDKDVTITRLTDPRQRRLV